MRRFSILVCAFTVSCASSAAPTTGDSGQVAESAKDVAVDHGQAVEQNGTLEESSEHAIPPLKKADTAAEPMLKCSVATDSPEVRKHLGLGSMGPTESKVTTPDGHGFMGFEYGGETYTAYICEARSADSDECDGAVVQVLELAKVVGDSTEVLWSSGPQLGTGNPACDEYGGNLFTDLDIADYDVDGRPDILFAMTDPTRPRATVRLFDGTTYVAMLPTGPAKYDLCRPTESLEYSVIKKGATKATPSKKVPETIKEELEDAYLTCAECPDAE